MENKIEISTGGKISDFLIGSVLIPGGFIFFWRKLMHIITHQWGVPGSSISFLITALLAAGILCLIWKRKYMRLGFFSFLILMFLLGVGCKLVLDSAHW